ncbi:NAD-dependent malic enzyme [Stackebrandtia nassauensis]|uniref:Malate dehydrogenase (Oxaloacetate-decarboxylating) n=1 Tax=Stackebrandtia nassauensis (strain DSM 44728 / CIP 108903 / NRRL B-16338 / NBRC 102104 / LLR-40K-21) TaxID=446470 RepID=D3Q6G6_STANL|nr:NAD-dependent malic enzyme [Stackebrandtia nassauensis]ADD44209.1 Malate dehydrogenase (oxaloacetate- decarboxylating) [Stackebrandtia nassauensis DSM 44728]
MSVAKLPSAGFSITVRVSLTADAGAIGRLTTAVGEAGAIVKALDVVSSDHKRVVVDLTCDTSDSAHAERVTDALASLPGITVRKVSDRTFLLHLGGKIEVTPKVSLRNRDELSMAYTPGVARVCSAIAENPDDARRLTIKRNTVAVVTDGSAVLGLGNLGPEAALPVMEGKAALFKKFAGVDAWPVCLDTQDTDEIVEIVAALAPVYGGINLEDIAAPRCFEIEARLRDRLNIPVFHDDQHGTAIVVLAALTNALGVVGKNFGDIRVTVSGAGAAGTAIMNLLLKRGIGDVIACDRPGALYRGMPGLSSAWKDLVERTNRENFSGTLAEAVAGSDVFIGVSAPNLLTGNDIARMATDPIVFALANPDPEIDPREAAEHAAIVATGRSDQPNQINNVLAFPGVFRGMLDAQATGWSDDAALAAADAIAGVVGADKANASFIVPSVFDPHVAPAVAQAVKNVLRPEPVNGDNGNGEAS